MKDRNHILSELEELAPHLAKLKREGPPEAEAPQGYFKSLKEDVLIRSRAEADFYGKEAAPRVSKTLFSPILQWLYRKKGLAALSLMLVLSCTAYWYFTLGTTATTTQEVALEQLEEQEINDYITQNIGEFGLSLLLESDVLEAATIDGIIATELTDEEMDEYLDDILEGLELEDLEEVL
jgi:hypothetical protein